MNKVKQFTRQEAIEFGESGKWKVLTSAELAALLLFQDRLCIPFDIGHKAIEEVFGRPVWTHEFADIERLRKEWRTGEKPTLPEIFEGIIDKAIFIEH